MPLLGAVGLWVSAMACGPSVVDLGARGGGVADSGADAAAATSGAGGTSGSGAAGVGQIGAGEAGSGTAAVGGGAGSGPSTPNDAGPAVPPDAGPTTANPEPSAGCGMQPPAILDTNITVMGSMARYIVDPATGYDQNKPYPLVFSFRGANVSVTAFRRTLDLPGVVGADGIVVNVDCANDAVMWDLQRDSQVFEALLAKLEASYCVDLRRVFVVGHETGAIFANVLACMHAPVLRGLGSISGVAPQGMVTCTGPLAVWISQGNAGMLRMLGQANRDFWLQQNHCNAMTASVEPMPCLEYMGCEMGNPVRYCEYDGNQTVPSFAAAAVWNFLKAL